MRGIEHLHPEMRLKAEQLQALCQADGLALLITDTWRTVAEQEDCVRRGTSRAHHPNSAHNWGVAFDFCKNIKGHEYDDATFFSTVGKLAKSIGLYWGGDFKSPDRPHVEHRDFVPNGSCSTLIKQYKTPEAFKAAWPDDPKSGGAEPAPHPGTDKKPAENTTQNVKNAWPTLSQGASGDDVHALQWALCYHGAALTADGQFGAKTLEAVKTFQRSAGLSADGVAGPKTWAALEKPSSPAS